MFSPALIRELDVEKLRSQPVKYLGQVISPQGVPLRDENERPTPAMYKVISEGLQAQIVKSQWWNDVKRGTPTWIAQNAERLFAPDDRDLIMQDLRAGFVKNKNVTDEVATSPEWRAWEDPMADLGSLTSYLAAHPRHSSALGQRILNALNDTATKADEKRRLAALYVAGVQNATAATRVKELLAPTSPLFSQSRDALIYLFEELAKRYFCSTAHEEEMFLEALSCCSAAACRTAHRDQAFTALFKAVELAEASSTRSLHRDGEVGTLLQATHDRQTVALVLPQLQAETALKNVMVPPVFRPSLALIVKYTQDVFSLTKLELGSLRERRGLWALGAAIVNKPLQDWTPEEPFFIQEVDVALRRAERLEERLRVFPESCSHVGVTLGDVAKAVAEVSAFVSNPSTLLRDLKSTWENKFGMLTSFVRADESDRDVILSYVAQPQALAHFKPLTIATRPLENIPQFARFLRSKVQETLTDDSLLSVALEFTQSTGMPNSSLPIPEAAAHFLELQPKLAELRTATSSVISWSSTKASYLVDAGGADTITVGRFRRLDTTSLEGVTSDQVAIITSLADTKHHSQFTALFASRGENTIAKAPDIVRLSKPKLVTQMVQLVSIHAAYQRLRGSIDVVLQATRGLSVGVVTTLEEVLVDLDELTEALSGADAAGVDDLQTVMVAVIQGKLHLHMQLGPSSANAAAIMETVTFVHNEKTVSWPRVEIAYRDVCLTPHGSTSLPVAEFTRCYGATRQFAGSLAKALAEQRHHVLRVACENNDPILRKYAFQFTDFNITHVDHRFGAAELIEISRRVEVLLRAAAVTSLKAKQEFACLAWLPDNEIYILLAAAAKAGWANTDIASATNLVALRVGAPQAAVDAAVRSACRDQRQLATLLQENIPRECAVAFRKCGNLGLLDASGALVVPPTLHPAGSGNLRLVVHTCGLESNYDNMAAASDSILAPESDYAQFRWTKAVVDYYATAAKRLPTIGEIAFFATPTSLDDLRSLRHVLERTSSLPADVGLLSIVFTPTRRDVMRAVAILTKELMAMRDDSARRLREPTGRELHVFVDTVADRYVLHKLENTFATVCLPDVVDADKPISAARELLALHTTTVHYAHDAPSVGKTTAVHNVITKRNARAPSASLLLMDGTTPEHARRFLHDAKLRTEKRVDICELNKLLKPVHVELSTVPSQDCVRLVFSLAVFGGIVTTGGRAVDTSDVAVLLETPAGTANSVTFLQYIPLGDMTKHPPTPMPACVPGSLVEAILGTSLPDVARANVTRLMGLYAQQPWFAANVDEYGTDRFIRIALKSAYFIARPASRPQLDRHECVSTANEALSECAASTWDDHDGPHAEGRGYVLAWGPDNVPFVVALCDEADLNDLPTHVPPGKPTALATVIKADPRAVAEGSMPDLRALLCRAAHATAPSALGKVVVTRHVFVAALRIVFARRVRLQHSDECTRRFACPSIMVGETGCGKTHLVQALGAALGVSTVIVEVNPSLDPVALHERLRNAADLLSPEPVLLFFDELNTWRGQDMIKSLMLDRRCALGGAAAAEARTNTSFDLPPTWHVVGACNPFRVLAEDPSNLAYAVEPRVHASIKALCWRFGNVLESEERSIVHSMATAAGLDVASVEYLARVVPLLHRFYRRESTTRVVSFRDAARCIRLTAEAAKVASAMGMPNMGTNEARRAHLAVALTYLVSIAPSNDLRAKIEAIAPEASAILRDAATYLTVPILQCDVGVVHHAALDETLVVVVLCVLTRTPLVLVGPPGTGKSLAPYLVCEANFVRCGLPSLVPFNFQCGEDTRPQPLEQIFRVANEGDEASNNATISTIILDEAGLVAAGATSDVGVSALKVLNRWLDREGVGERTPAFVATTNVFLDRSIMNRAVCHVRDAPDHVAIVGMLKDLRLDAVTEKADNVAARVIASAARRSYDLFAETDHDMLGMRDLFAFVRDLRATRDVIATLPDSDDENDDGKVTSIDKRIVCHFGPASRLLFPKDDKGDPIAARPPARFDDFRQECLLHRLRAIAGPSAGEPSCRLTKKSSLDGDRAIMLETNSFSAANALIRRATASNTTADPVYICGAICTDDGGMLQKHMQLLTAAMHAGRVVVLAHTPKLLESLMAALSGYIVHHGSSTLVRVTRDGQSDFCQVRPGFKIIVLRVKERASEAVAIERSHAFFDRVERHIVDGKLVRQQIQWNKIGALARLAQHRPRIVDALVLPDFHNAVFGWHTSMLAHAVDDAERLTVILRLVHPQRLFYLLVQAKRRTIGEGTPLGPQEVLACLETVQQVVAEKRLRQLAADSRFLCILCPDSTSFGGEAHFSATGGGAGMDDLFKANLASMLDDRANMHSLKSTATAWLGPYNFGTPDSALLLDLDYALSVTNATVVVLVDWADDRVIDALSYRLFALCELICTLACSTVRVVLYVRCAAADPEVEVHHRGWDFVCVDGVQPLENLRDTIYDSEGHALREAALARLHESNPKVEAEAAICATLHQIAHHPDSDVQDAFVKLRQCHAAAAGHIAALCLSASMGVASGAMETFGHMQARFDVFQEIALQFCGALAMHMSNTARSSAFVDKTSRRFKPDTVKTVACDLIKFTKCLPKAGVMPGFTPFAVFGLARATAPPDAPLGPHVTWLRSHCVFRHTILAGAATADEALHRVHWYVTSRASANAPDWTKPESSTPPRFYPMDAVYTCTLQARAPAYPQWLIGLSVSCRLAVAPAVVQAVLCDPNDLDALAALSVAVAAAPPAPSTPPQLGVLLSLPSSLATFFAIHGPAVVGDKWYASCDKVFAALDASVHFRSDEPRSVFQKLTCAYSGTRESHAEIHGPLVMTSASLIQRALTDAECYPLRDLTEKLFGDLGAEGGAGAKPWHVVRPLVFALWWTKIFLHDSFLEPQLALLTTADLPEFIVHYTAESNVGELNAMLANDHTPALAFFDALSRNAADAVGEYNRVIETLNEAMHVCVEDACRGGSPEHLRATFALCYGIAAQPGLASSYPWLPTPVSTAVRLGKECPVNVLTHIVDAFSIRRVIANAASCVESAQARFAMLRHGLAELLAGSSKFALDPTMRERPAPIAGLDLIAVVSEISAARLRR
jgi:hypothetical protein